MDNMSTSSMAMFVTAVPCQSGSPSLPRLALLVLREMIPNGLFLAAPDCSSWGVPARGTSKRNYINANGDLRLEWVSKSNTMVSRKLA